MNEQIQIGLFEKLSLRHWYKYLLYISGILLILAVFLDLKIEQNKVIDFSLWTIGLSLFLWILDDVFRATSDYYDEQRVEGDSIREEQKTVIIIREVIHVIVLIIWAIFIASKLF
jgi:hypothetical protein